MMEPTQPAPMLLVDRLNVLYGRAHILHDLSLEVRAGEVLALLGRAFELRVSEVTFDHLADTFVRDCATRTIRFVANEPDRGDRAEYSDKLRQVTKDNDIPDAGDVIFVEAGVPHRFEGYGEDFATWVVFWGPEGGEAAG